MIQEFHAMWLWLKVILTIVGYNSLMFKKTPLFFQLIGYSILPSFFEPDPRVLEISHDIKDMSRPSILSEFEIFKFHEQITSVMCLI
jgi:hypothetical protein